MVLTNDDLEKIKNIVYSTISDKLLNKIAAKVSDIVESKFEAKLAIHNQAVDKLNLQVTQLQVHSKMLEKRIDEQEQNSRRLNVRVFGIPALKDENTREVVLKLFRDKLKIDVKNDEIANSYRIRAKNPNDKPPAIMVRFVSDNVRNAILANRKQIKTSTVQVKEDLTKFRLSLLNAAVKKFSFKNAWCLNGSVYFRQGKDVHKVSDLSDVEDI